MRPLPLSENGLKGLLDSQPQGPAEARAMGPGWGRCTAGKWSKAGKGKNTHSTLMGSGLQAWGKQGRQPPWLFEEPSLPGHLACPSRERGRTQAGLWQDTRALFRDVALGTHPLQAPPFPASPSLPEPVRSAQAAPALTPGQDAVPGLASTIQPFSLAQPAPSSYHKTCSQIRLVTEQKGCTYPPHPTSWGCLGISRPLRKHCSGW